jgi:glycosyltransferase involved in cell wall biosynthesis
MIRRQQRDDWRESVTRFIALSNFAREKFISGGLKPERVIVKPNGLEDPKVYSHERNQERYGALFVGRLSYEKGVKTLVEGWKSIKYPLRIVGEGPLLDELRRNAPESILFLGKLEREQIFYEMSRSAFMVMPSLSYEGFPMTLVESLACGLPIISSKIGSLTELIQHGVTGLHIHPGSSDDLARKALEIIDNLELRQQMSYAARAKYLENYTSRKSLERLVEIYQSAIAR